MADPEHQFHIKMFGTATRRLMTNFLTVPEPARTVPVIATVDVCVLGGSCTGVFAAVRAARLGASVALVEKLNAFGGTATHGLVNVWHSLHDGGSLLH